MGGLDISDDGRSATLELKNLPVIDQPKWPARDAPAVPAKMNFRVDWKATDDKIFYEDKRKHFKVEGYGATAQVEATVVVRRSIFLGNLTPWTLPRPSLPFSAMRSTAGITIKNSPIISDESNDSPDQLVAALLPGQMPRSSSAICPATGPGCRSRYKNRDSLGEVKISNRY